MSNNNEDEVSSIRAFKSTIRRLNAYSEQVFQTDRVPNDVLINHLIEQAQSE